MKKYRLGGRGDYIDMHCSLFGDSAVNLDIYLRVSVGALEVIQNDLSTGEFLIRTQDGLNSI